MNEPETGDAPEAARGSSDLQKELAEVLRQRAAISVDRREQSPANRAKLLLTKRLDLRPSN